jgi:hypothetical protein
MSHVIFHGQRAVYERNAICQPNDVMYANSLGNGKNFKKIIFHKRRSGVVPVMDARFIPRVYQDKQQSFYPLYYQRCTFTPT